MLQVRTYKLQVFDDQETIFVCSCLISKFQLMPGGRLQTVHYLPPILGSSSRIVTRNQTS